MTIEQSEEPITQNSMLLQQVQRTTIALKSHLSSILTEIGNLSPQAIKETTASYKAQIDALSTQLASIDITEISKVKSSIDSFSISIQALQNNINSQLQSISIDKPSLQKSIQAQVQQAIANQSEQIESEIQTLITEKLSTQRATHMLWGDDPFWTADSFNNFISSLSSQYKPKDHRSATRSHSTEFTSDYQPNQIFEQLTEIGHADRNRPLFDRAKRLIESTKQLVSGAKQGFESTSRFIKDHLDRLQRSRARTTGQNQHFAIGETGTTSLDLGTQNRAIQNRARQLFGAVTANISGKLENPITNAISESIESTGFKQRCQRLGEGRVKTNSNDHWHTADRHREGTLENLAIESTNQLLRRFGDAKQADQYAGGNCREINNVNQQLERLETTLAEIRLKPKPATNFNYLRSDGYYPDYVGYHKKLCDKQQEAYNNKNHYS